MLTTANMSAGAASAPQCDKYSDQSNTLAFHPASKKTQDFIHINYKLCKSVREYYFSSFFSSSFTIQYHSLNSSNKLRGHGFKSLHHQDHFRVITFSKLVLSQLSLPYLGDRILASLAGVKATCVYLCRVEGNTV